MSSTSKSAGTEIKGHLFESKLTTLFMVRAINSGYQFELATNNEQVGDKFDDVIFRYEVPDNTPESKHWRYRYVQAKHKVNKNALKIKASHLLSASTKENDYNIFKYFKSFCKFKVRGDDIQDCIICTTIDFDTDDFKKEDGIQLKLVDASTEKIFKFEDNYKNNDGTIPTIYKLELPAEVRKKLFESVDIQILAEKLIECATMSHAPTLKEDIFNSYHVALIEENVIEFSANQTKTMKFHKDFIDNLHSLTNGAKDLRQVLCNMGHENDLINWRFQRPGNFGRIDDVKQAHSKLPNSITDNDVNEFCEKLFFVVNSPSEDELDAITHSDLSKFYNPDDIQTQFLRIRDQVLDWFKSIKSEESEWLSSENGKISLVEGVNQNSTAYRNNLMKELGFNDNAVRQMTEKLESLNNKIIRVSSETPNWTAVKIISAIENELQDRNYWVTSSNLLNESVKQWKNRLELTKNHLFLIVCGKYEASEFKLESLIPGDPMWMGKIIILSAKKGGIKDEIKFKDLNTETQSVILNRSISFQEEEIKVGRLLVEMSDEEDVVNLLNNSEMVEKLDKILKFPSILELMKPEEIKIPSLN